MNVIINAASAMLMLLAATGTYNLQSWLERSDYDRHFED